MSSAHYTAMTSIIEATAILLSVLFILYIILLERELIKLHKKIDSLREQMLEKDKKQLLLEN